MEKYLKMYAAFAVMSIVTAVLVRPTVANIPLLNKI